MCNIHTANPIFSTVQAVPYSRCLAVGYSRLYLLLKLCRRRYRMGFLPPRPLEVFAYCCQGTLGELLYDLVTDKGAEHKTFPKVL